MDPKCAILGPTDGTYRWCYNYPGYPYVHGTCVNMARIYTPKWFHFGVFRMVYQIMVPGPTVEGFWGEMRGSGG